MGITSHPKYKTWELMRNRCSNPKNKRYKFYGGKGIRVCDRWERSFHRFIEDMGVPDEGLTLDRIDNSKGYYRENCRWVSVTEQNRNRSNNVYIDVFGRSFILEDCIAASRYTKTAYYSRVRRGIDRFAALFSINKIISPAGEFCTIKEAAIESGVKEYKAINMVNDPNNRDWLRVGMIDFDALCNLI